jgi:hypothetical protein
MAVEHAVCVTDPKVLGAAVRQGVDVVAGGRRDRKRTRTGRWLRAIGATPSPGVPPADQMDRMDRMDRVAG